MQVTVKCDRCGQMVSGIETTEATEGFSNVMSFCSWSKKYARPGEQRVCDACMWADPGYRKDYHYNLTEPHIETPLDAKGGHDEQE